VFAGAVEAGRHSSTRASHNYPTTAPARPEAQQQIDLVERHPGSARCDFPGNLEPGGVSKPLSLLRTFGLLRVW